MKLDDFLKTKKVRCVKAYGDCLTVGKEYSVLNIRMEVEVRDDEGGRYYWESDHFEPVLDSAENPLQNIELTPEFENEASEPKFKVGDKVYLFGKKHICTIKLVVSDNQYLIDRLTWAQDARDLVLATQENYERLQTTFPDIEFERPLTQADIDNEAVDKLAQAMKNKLAKKREKGYHGWETCKHSELVQLLINHVDKGDPIDVANFCAFLFARGEQLTQGGTR